MDHFSIRHRTQEIERQILSSNACLVSASKGRAKEEEADDFRTDFQRDRDRILNSNAFSRLKEKTQVFLAPCGDHYRTRLVHSLEVSQISRTIARGLGLNEDLVEAIALGHDIGHSPFGHSGEEVLNQVCPHGFSHSENGVRVVNFLANHGKGLNLTYEVIDGIKCHSFGGDKAKTLEGRLVSVCDKVAYVNHDIDDAIRAGMLSMDDLPQDCLEVLGSSKSQRISTVARSIIQNSDSDIKMSSEVSKAQFKLRDYMFKNIYYSNKVQLEQDKARNIVKMLYKYYRSHNSKLPEFYKQIAKKFDVDRAICDYISGMSDVYITEQYIDFFIPKFLGT